MGFFDFLTAPAKPRSWPPEPEWWKAIHARDVRRSSYYAPESTRRGPEPSRQAPGRTPPAADPMNPALYFNLFEIWKDIREGREEKDFQEALEGGEDAILALLEIAPKEKQAQAIFKFFNLPVEEARRRADLDIWEDWIDPFIEKLEKRMNEIMPDEFQGYLEFGDTEQGPFGLFYIERREKK